MDAIIIICVFILTLILPFALMGLKYWAYFWGTLTLALGVWEGIVYLRKGKTLSQRFWKFKEENPKKAWILLGTLLLFWGLLLWHLFGH